VTFSTVGRYGRTVLEQPRDVVVRNGDCIEHRFAISATVGGELGYLSDRWSDAPPGSIARDAGALAEAGDYRFTVEGERRSHTGEVRLEPDEDRGVLIDVDGDGRVAVGTRPSADLPATGRIDCEAADRPYESPDPIENLPRPVGIEWVNHADAERDAAVTVRDGERTVLDRTLVLAAGGKGRTEPLTARRGIYKVDLSSPDGDPVSVRWDVSTGSLSLLVEERGLEVASGALA